MQLSKPEQTKSSLILLGLTLKICEMDEGSILCVGLIILHYRGKTLLQALSSSWDGETGQAGRVNSTAICSNSWLGLSTDSESFFLVCVPISTQVDPLWVSGALFAAPFSLVPCPWPLATSVTPASQFHCFNSESPLHPPGFSLPTPVELEDASSPSQWRSLEKLAGRGPL